MSLKPVAGEFIICLSAMGSNPSGASSWLHLPLFLMDCEMRFHFIPHRTKSVIAVSKTQLLSFLSTLPHDAFSLRFSPKYSPQETFVQAYLLWIWIIKTVQM